MEIVRKGNNFRVVMERKLGVDWEHDPQECPSEILQSVQTNQVLDGYECAEDNSFVMPRTLSMDSDSMPEFGRPSIFAQEYRRLDRMSFTNKGAEENNGLIGRQSEIQAMAVRKQQVIESLFLDQRQPYQLK